MTYGTSHHDTTGSRAVEHKLVMRPPASAGRSWQEHSRKMPKTDSKVRLGHNSEALLIPCGRVGCHLLPKRLPDQQNPLQIKFNNWTWRTTAFSSWRQGPTGWGGTTGCLKEVASELTLLVSWLLPSPSSDCSGGGHPQRHELIWVETMACWQSKLQFYIFYCLWVWSSRLCKRQ